MAEHEVIIDTERCIGCGLCARVCVAHNLAVQDQKARTLLDSCILCGQCTAVCPGEAIRLSGYHDEQFEAKNAVPLDPDQVLDAIRFRRSIRAFRQEAIPQAVIARILEAGRLTHTAKNAQDVSFVVLEKEMDQIEAMAVRLFRAVKPLADLFSPMARGNKIDDHFFFFHAPAVIVILAKDKTNGLLAAQNMEFVAESQGLGVLYSGFFTMAANASRKIRNALMVPGGKKVAMTLVLGYPAVKFLRSTPHKELDVKYL